MNYNEIQEQFNEILSKTQNIDLKNINTDNIFVKWWDNKKDIYKKFGNKLILELPEPITFSMSEDEKENLFQSYIDYIFDYVYVNSNIDLIETFLKNQKETFFDNKVEKLNPDFPQITNGMKISKALKFFIEEPSELRKAQEEYSRILQNLKITGKFCLSIHPLDFLSVSENNNNWRSCHAMNGEYRSGNLNYMLDSTTIVAYIKGEKDEKIHGLGNFVWNSKKWRTLIFSNENRDILAIGRHYPFFIKGVFNYIRDIFIEHDLMSRNCGSWIECIKEIKQSYISNSNNGLYHDKITLEYPHFVSNGKFINLRNIIKENPYKNFYNDLLFSSVAKPWVLKNYFYGYDYFKQRPIIIGKDAPCICCGQSIIEDTDLMVCPDCALTKTTEDSDRFFTCPECGERYYREDGEFVYQGEIGTVLLCSKCAKDYD